MEGDAAMLQHNVIPTKLTAQREAASEKGHPGALQRGLRTPAKKYTVCSNTVRSLQVAIFYSEEHT
jgi:hypothetical protein